MKVSYRKGGSVTILTPSHGSEPRGEGPSVDRGCAGGVIEPRKDARTRVPTPSGSAEGNTGWIDRTRDPDRPGAVGEQRMHTTNSARENRESSWPPAADGQTSRKGKAKAAILR